MLKNIAHLWSGLFGGCFSACVFCKRSLFSTMFLGKLTKHLERTSSLIHFEQRLYRCFSCQKCHVVYGFKEHKRKKSCTLKKSNEIQIKISETKVAYKKDETPQNYQD